MPPFDREAALKGAEKALRQGRIDAAIAEYVKVVEAQPRDWNSANALGDLYVRANQLDKGLQQFTRIADRLAGEGFYAKAAALFKKILKLKPEDEYALLQSGDLAARQGTLADAKQYFQAVADRRKARGDKKGAAEVAIRLGTLDPDDLEARLRAAQLAAETGDSVTALREFHEVAARYEKQDRRDEALAALQAAFDLDQSDESTRVRLVGAYLSGSTPALARKVASGAVELKQVAAAFERAGQGDAGLEVLAEVAAADPSDIEVRAHLALAYVAKGDLDKARTYLSAETAGHDPALWITLGEMELTAGRTDEGRAAVTQALTLDRNQAQAAVVVGCRLAESNPEAGYQCIDAVAVAALADGDYAAAAASLHEFTIREPWNRANLDRFRRALVMLGEADPDAIIAGRLSGDSPFLAIEKLDLNEGISFDEPAPAAPPEPGAMTPPPPRSLDQVFRGLRDESNRQSSEEAAVEQYRLALTYHEMGMTEDAMKALEGATRSPRQRFDAASMLGRLYLERQEMTPAIEWLERAADAPAPTVDAGRSLLYDLAQALETVGESSRALAVFVELESESGGYRDVLGHIDRLSKVQARG